MTYRIIKRTFDLICAILGMIISSPMWLFVAIGIKLSSKGPVFFKTERIGLNNQAFTMYKFRTMHVYQPVNENSERKSEGGYIANTQRIFPLGSFLRKSKLDELPQLLNVLFSQMSVVGPRPITRGSVDKNYVGEYASILDVKPGLACLDSLFDYAHGELFISDNEEYVKKILPVRIELARIYVEKKCISLDLHIIFRTIQLIFIIVFTKNKNFAYTKYEKEAIDVISKNRF